MQDEKKMGRRDQDKKNGETRCEMNKFVRTKMRPKGRTKIKAQRESD